MKKKNIGIVTINYDLQGQVTHAEFTPHLKVSLDEDDLLSQLKPVNSDTQAETIKANADMVLGSWFAKITEIELAERDEYQVIGKLRMCDNHPGTSIPATCVIEYFFEKI